MLCLDNLAIGQHCVWGMLQSPKPPIPQSSQSPIPQMPTFRPAYTTVVSTAVFTALLRHGTLILLRHTCCPMFEVPH